MQRLTCWEGPCQKTSCPGTRHLSLPMLAAAPNKGSLPAGMVQIPQNLSSKWHQFPTPAGGLPLGTHLLPWDLRVLQQHPHPPMSPGHLCPPRPLHPLPPGKRCRREAHRADLTPSAALLSDKWLRSLRIIPRRHSVYEMAVVSQEPLRCGAGGAAPRRAPGSSALGRLQPSRQPGRIWTTGVSEALVTWGIESSVLATSWVIHVRGVAPALAPLSLRLSPKEEERAPKPLSVAPPTLGDSSALTAPDSPPELGAPLGAPPAVGTRPVACSPTPPSIPPSRSEAPHSQGTCPTPGSFPWHRGSPCPSQG